MDSKDRKPNIGDFLKIKSNLRKETEIVEEPRKKKTFGFLAPVSGTLKPRAVTADVQQALAQTKQDLNVKTEEVKDKSKRFYLPVLYLNDPTQWDSKPLSERKHFTDETALKTCVGNCCNVPGLKAGCCSLDPDDIEHVLGGLDEEWISDMIQWLTKRGVPTRRSDIVIDYEEGVLIGEKFFNSHDVFKSKESYPMIRFQVNGPRFSCKFLHAPTGMCTIYEKRPDMCRNYLCQFVKSNFLVRTKSHPNRYVKIR